MTVTKRYLLKALAEVDDDDVILVDNGVECRECRAATVVRPNNRRDLCTIISGLANTDGQMPDDGSVILRLS